MAIAGKKILVVDDSEIARQNVIQALREGGYEIVEAEHGKDALTKFAADPDISLVISDVIMPEMDGLELAEAIRQQSVNAQVAIILVTTESSSDQVKRGLACKVSGWLIKPFDPKKLITAVNKVIKSN